MTKLIENIPPEVTEAVTESLRLVRQAQFSNPSDRQEASQSLPSLLERCEQYIGAEHQPRQEAVRLIHHFACTGGTLVAKCVASMPNTQLLSEVEPHSPIPQQRRSRFAPTDLIGLLRNSSRGSDSGLESRLFMVAIKALHEDCMTKGLRLVLRDHAHSSYCTGPAVSAAPNLRRLLSDRHILKSVVTVRHPLDSWLSLSKNNWINFQPSSLEEYAGRYHRFLDDHSDLPNFRYEDFVNNPDQEIQKICIALDLPYLDGYRDLFSVHQLSGDSGRTSDFIGPRPRWVVSAGLAQEAHASKPYQALCRRLGYEP